MRSRSVARPTSTVVRCALLCASTLVVLASSASAVRAEDVQTGEVFATEERNRVYDYHYDSDYLFGVTRGLAGSDMHLAAKIPWYFLSVPTDIVLVPFAAILGTSG